MIEKEVFAKAAKGDFEYLEEILVKSPTIIFIFDADGLSLLHWASYYGDQHAASILLECGSQVDAENNNRQTALLIACSRGHNKMILLLFKHGADLQARDSEGSNAIITAIKHNQVFTAYFLIRHGVRKDATDMQGRNSFHWATYTGSIQLLRIFEQDRQSFSIKDLAGCTPLHCAVYGNNLEAVKYLIQIPNTKDLTTRNINNVTPLELAINMNRTKEMIKALRIAERRSKAIRMPWNHPATKKRFWSFLWILCYVLTIFTQLAFIKPFTLSNSPVLSIMMDGCLIIHGILYIFVAAFNPGFIQPNTIDFESIIKESNTDLESTAICFTCNIVKPVRSKHCRICNKCIYRFDHHCNWTANCVGKKNHPTFVAFVIVQQITHILTSYLSSWAFLATLNSDLTYVSKFFYLGFMIIVNIIHYIGLFVTGKLVNRQVRMVFLNETSNETINRERYAHFWKVDKDSRQNKVYYNPFSQGYKRNCEQFCFGALEPPEPSVYVKLENGTMNK